MSDGRRGRLRHADMVDGDVVGSMGMGGKAIVSVNELPLLFLPANEGTELSRARARYYVLLEHTPSFICFILFVSYIKIVKIIVLLHSIR